MTYKCVHCSQGREHSHAFYSVPSLTRVAEVVFARGRLPEVTSGLRNLRVLKTTQSAFVNFVDDEFRTLPDAKDRLFSTIVTADWKYNNVRGLDFDSVFSTVRDTILEVFAGPADTGIFSPSVQNSQFLTQKLILEKFPKIESVSMEMPNVHYFGFDFSKFKRIPGLLDKVSLIFATSLIRVIIPFISRLGERCTTPWTSPAATSPQPWPGRTSGPRCRSWCT